MAFADTPANEHFQMHPEHTRFVQQRWLAAVVDLLEMEYVLC